MSAASPSPAPLLALYHRAQTFGGSFNSVLDVLSRADPARFASLVTLVLSAYYQAPKVVAAFGWPARPPQPMGHVLPAFDERLLEPVRRRGPIWRQA